MIDTDEISRQALIFHESDFPRHYRKMLHPYDLKFMTDGAKLETEYMFPKQDQTNRLLCRLPIQLGPVHFTMATFVLNTACSAPFLIGSPLMKMLMDHGRIKDDKEMQIACLETDFGHNPHVNHREFYRVEPTPSEYGNANVIGLRVLMKLGLHLDEHEVFFENEPHYI